MNLVYPLGLIALIGIPLLIIIYIIKPRYQEKKISSTYIWQLSLKYKKKKRPIQWLQKSLLFFIQLVIITFIALAITRPELLLQAKSKEKIIILDVSASMNAENGGVSLFEKAIKEIQILANDVDEEDPMTVILANENPEILLNRETSTKYINYALNKIECSFEEANYEKSLELANEVLEINNDAEVILYTDHNFSQEGYVNVKNLSNKEWNAGISSFNAVLKDGYYIFEITIENYNSAQELDLYLNIDNKKYEKTVDLRLSKEDKQEIIINDLNVSSFTSAKASLLSKGKDIKDSFIHDNQFMIYENQNKKFTVQLVGNETNFIMASLLSTGLCTVSKPEVDEIAYEGYDIYIFDSYMPEQLPTDGAIWLFNCPDTPKSLDYLVVDDVEGDFHLQSTNTDTLSYRQIMSNTLSLSDVLVTKYQKVTSIGDYEVMITCNGDPVAFTGKYGKAKVVVFALDIHYTELPVNINMPILINNMVNYSAHNLLDKYAFKVGENITLYPKLRTEVLTINDEVLYTSDDSENVIYLTAKKPGRYEVKQVLEDGNVIVNYYYVRIAEAETNFNYVGDVLAAEEYISSSQAVNKSTNNFDIIVYVSALLLLLIVIEWGLSYHEQY